MGKIASFDIETFCPLDELTEEDISYLKGRKDYDLDEDFHKDLALNPYVSYIISCSLFFLEENRCYVFYMDEKKGKEESKTKIGEREVDSVYISFSLKDGLFNAERELLEHLWERLEEVDTLITYNGKSFDMDFLKIRTIMHDMMPKVFHKHINSKIVNHIDLMGSLRVGGNSYTLKFISRRFGLNMDKDDMDGSKVKGAFLNKQYKKIADYNIRDALLAGMLYEKVRKYISTEYAFEMAKDVGFSGSEDLINYAINNELLSTKDASILMSLCPSATASQIESLKKLMKNHKVDLRLVCRSLPLETILRIFAHKTELSKYEEEIT